MTNRLRGMVLWQMQESRAHIFYMLTTNKRALLPPELIREGRIDTILVFQGLLADEAEGFALTILRSFIEKPTEAVVKETLAKVGAMYGDADRMSHSAITATVKKVVKAAFKLSKEA
jgi:SpoVK/Ycf46/Vps4 family AAA+-type ATPase